MLRQLWWKRRKILRGLLRARLRRPAAYEPAGWWDRDFYVGEVADRTTISARKTALSAMYHYASVELLVLRELCRAGVDLERARVLDVGSGAGHWIDFYRRAGAGRCVGVELSERCADHLRGKYAGDDAVEIHHGHFQEVLEDLKPGFDLINAIGVMFHVVDDADWERGLQRIADGLNEGGWLVVGGHFGWLDGLDVQVDARGAVNKRLRSRRSWRRTLRALGFGLIRIHRNPAYLWISDTLPENHLLTARKGPR